MPYTFEVVIIMKREEHEEMSIVRSTHNLYQPVIMQLIEAWTMMYRQNGWRVHRYYEQNFKFHEEANYPHG